MTPSGTIDHVVANAGIAIDDEVFSYDGTAFLSYSPSKPQANAKADRSRISFEASQSEDS